VEIFTFNKDYAMHQERLGTASAAPSVVANSNKVLATVEQSAFTPSLNLMNSEHQNSTGDTQVVCKDYFLKELGTAKMSTFDITTVADIKLAEPVDETNAPATAETSRSLRVNVDGLAIS
jgi:hypothetical protein